MSTKRNLAIGGAVAAVVVVAVVLGCVFGLAGPGEQEPCVKKEDNRTKGILITGGEPSLQVLMSGGANPGVEAELYIPEENKFCKLPKLPEIRWTHTMEVVDGKPVICGGAKQKHGDTATGYTCMQFSPLSSEGEWKTDYAKLSCPRTRHTSWVTCDGEMVQLGGGNCFTGETVGGSTKFNLPMRQAKRDACLIDVGDSVIITGGQSSEYVVEKYNKDTFEKEALPSLLTGRYTHGCGSYKDSEGNTVLVVAGGSKDAKNNYEEAPSTETLKLGDTEWKTAADLPYDLNSMASISWTKTNSVFFIGGDKKSGGHQPKTTEILAFDGKSWKEIAKLPGPGRSSSAVTQVVVEDYKDFCN